jgi:hypothetical protein
MCTFVPVKQVNIAPYSTHLLRITFPDDVLSREFTTDFNTAIAHSLRITFPDDVLARTQYWDAVLQLGEGPIVEWPREHAAGGSQGTRFTCFTGTKVQILQFGEGTVVEWPREHAAGGSQGTRFT